MSTKTFADLGVLPELTDELARHDIVEAFPIQELAIPMALKGADIIGQARTGTGKTLAFGLPLLQRIDPDLGCTQALVVTPTRELCLQVAGDLEIGELVGIDVQTVYGGVGYEEQIAALTSGVPVVVGTPGRLLDHLGRGNLDLSGLTELVLDEADEMLDMGFLPDVERLIEASPSDRHSMLFSATMPSAIVKLARRYMTHPTFLRADVEEHEVAPTVDQHFFLVHRMDKPRILARILQSPERGGAYVFTRTKRMADRLVRELDDLHVSAIAVHGDKRQATRERNMDKFREGAADVLVATEVAARGLDVDNVTHVINYDCPNGEKMYLHRIGRTARAGADGVAVTFAEFNQIDRLNVIRRAVDTDREVEEVFSTSDLLTELFDLPPHTPWEHLGGTDRRDTARAGRDRDGQARDGQDRDGSGRRRSGGSPEADRTGSAPVRTASRNHTPSSQREPALTRTRTRTLERTSASADRDTDRDRDSAHSGDDGSHDSGRGGGAPTRTRVRARSGDGTGRGRKGRSTRARSTASPSTEGSGSRPSDNGSGGGRSPEREDAGTRRSLERTTVEPVVLHTPGAPARGPGRPRLSRRLVVDHLP